MTQTTAARCDDPTLHAGRADHRPRHERGGHATRRRALRITARVAWAALALGCGGSNQPAPPAPTVAVQATPAPQAPPAPMTTQSATPDPQPPANVGGHDDFAECQEKVRVASTSDKSGANASDELKRCCGELQKPHDADMGAKWEDNERYYCCSALGWGSGGACTPWGPPMPPTVTVSPGTEPEWLDLRTEARRHAPDVAAPEALRHAAIETWRARMVNEHGSAPVFEGLAGQLDEAGFDEDTVERCAGFAVEERRHGVLCGAVVEALGGEARALTKGEEPFVDHPGVDATEAALRNVLSVCCLSETVAVALIGAERIDMERGPLRSLLTQIFSEEVGHAQFGWELLGQTLGALDEERRTALSSRLGAYLRLAFRHLEAHELAHLPVTSRPPREGAALGLCDGRAARDLFYEAVEEVIVPCLDAIGLDASGAWETRMLKAA